MALLDRVGVVRGEPLVRVAVSNLIGDEYVGIPLDFLVRVLVFLSPRRFSCDDVIDDCLDLGMVRADAPPDNPEAARPAKFKELFDDEFDISPPCNIRR